MTPRGTNRPGIGQVVALVATLRMLHNAGALGVPKRYTVHFRFRHSGLLVADSFPGAVEALTYAAKLVRRGEEDIRVTCIYETAVPYTPTKRSQ